MVYGTIKQKPKLKSIWEELAWTKMAAPLASQPHSPRTPRSAKQSQPTPTIDVESDTDLGLGISPLAFQSDPTHPDLLKQFKWMLTKALKQTSDKITDRLSWEIRELGQRTARLEQ